MKYFQLLVLSFLLSITSIAQDTLKVDNGHSNVRFEVGWQDFSIRTGEFKTFDGYIVANSLNDLSDAIFYLEVDPGSIDVISGKFSTSRNRSPFSCSESLSAITSIAQDTLKVDNGHSNVRFEVGWQDFSIRTGEFKTFDGYIVTNSLSDLSDAIFYLEVDPGSIDVIADKLSEQLKGERFLDVENFPELTFSASETKKYSDSIYVATGKIKIHGVEKEQEVHINYKGQTIARRSQILGIEVSLSLNRTDFGLDWGSPRLGEQVKVVGHILFQIRVEEEE